METNPISKMKFISQIEVLQSNNYNFTADEVSNIMYIVKIINSGKIIYFL